jgi:hypothetical protein
MRKIMQMVAAASGWAESHIIPLCLTGLAMGVFVSTGDSVLTRWLGLAVGVVWFMFLAVDADEAFEFIDDDDSATLSVDEHENNYQ